MNFSSCVDCNFVLQASQVWAFENSWIMGYLMTGASADGSVPPSLQEFILFNAAPENQYPTVRYELQHTLRFSSLSSAPSFSLVPQLPIFYQKPPDYTHQAEIISLFVKSAAGFAVADYNRYGYPADQMHPQFFKSSGNTTCSMVQSNPSNCPNCVLYPFGSSKYTSEGAKPSASCGSP
jgi:hypothetical protein